jgi:hemoglobin-like flavoprotein
MTPEQVSLVTKLVGRLKAEPGFAPAFYARLFQAAPETEALFADVEAQGTKLTEELDALARLLDDLGALEQRAGDLGRRHRTYGVRVAHYEVARRCMAEAIEDVLGDDLDEATRAAWARAYNLVAELMLTGR